MTYRPNPPNEQTTPPTSRWAFFVARHEMFFNFITGLVATVTICTILGGSLSLLGVLVHSFVGCGAEIHGLGCNLFTGTFALTTLVIATAILISCILPQRMWEIVADSDCPEEW